MTRSGMAVLIHTLRELTDTNQNNLTDIGEQRWSDDRLEKVLDWYRRTFWRVWLEPATPGVRGNRYVLPKWAHDFENNGSGSGWRIYDVNGGLIDNDLYHVHDEDGSIVFDCEMGAGPYYADFRVYDLNRSAADVWEIKAVVAQHRVRPTGPLNEPRGVEYERCLRMADWFRHQAGPTLVHWLFADEA